MKYKINKEDSLRKRLFDQLDYEFWKRVFNTFRDGMNTTLDERLWGQVFDLMHERLYRRLRVRLGARLHR